ncbi:MAG: fasciclin domain-containing protein [Actinobacteria bacterium]|nr:fasciclin domain-containing protein [Actinomycetota bacterium]MCA0308257.1 fasciclin domain-containing protein [Actinomycetota bacterium]
MKSILTAAAIIGLGLVATGCTATTPAAPSPSAPATSAASTPAPTMSESAAPDIVDTAVAAGDFTTLAQALTAAGLVETLKGEGPFTVFAPTDEAFAKLPDGALDGLLKDKEALTGVLTYHVVPGEVMAAQVAGMDGQKVTTVQGGTFTVNVKDGKVSLTDGAGNTVNVVKTDITASNGVIHVIDGVLLPSK